jgi:hypothetical protein
MGSLVNELVDLNHHNAANPISFNVMISSSPVLEVGRTLANLQVEDFGFCQYLPGDALPKR